MTFLTARRAIRTSARDCEIRGGEYVAFDRANYATALKVWLPLAQQGDAAAQTYVGEIFEKGLGVPPDYSAAAEWYRRAAESGYSRAAINLGNLFEQGLGVPKDSAQALNWYRRAAGLKELNFEIVPGKTAAELQQLRAQVAELRSQLQAKQAELDRAQGDLEKLRRSLEERRGEADSERATLARLRRELDEVRGKSAGDAARLNELGRSIAEGEARSAAKDRDIAALRASVARAEAARQGEAESERGALARTRRELDELRGRSASDTARLNELQRSIADGEGRLAAKDRDIAALRASVARAEAARQGEAESERGALARLRQDFDELRRKSAGDTARVDELGRANADGEARLAAKDRDIGALRASIARAEAESSAQRAALDREVAALRASLAKAEAESSAQRAGLERLTQQAADAGPKIELVQVQLIEPELVAATRGVQAPPQAAAPAGPAVMLVGRVTSGVGVKSFTVNQRDQPVEKDSFFRTQIPVPESAAEADRRVRLVAVDLNGRSSALEFLMPAISTGRRETGASRALGDGGQPKKVGLPRPKLSLGEYHALVIGNNNYRNLPRLRTAVNDATEVANILRDQYRFKVKLLTNATRYEILSALNALRQELTSKDNLLVYYAGHGYLDEKNQRGHWLPIDAEPDNTANWVANADITAILNIMEVKQLLLVVDSCYSGTLTRSATGQLESGMTQEELFDVIRKMAQQRSRLVMTSGGVEPVLDSAGGRHSAFAEVFLQVLRDNDGVLLGREVFRRLQLRVAAMAERLSVPQVPEYAPIRYGGHEAGDFVFVRPES